MRMLRQRRFWLGLVVGAAWIAMMTALVRREVIFGGGGLRELGLSPEVLLVSWTNYEHWLGISQNGKSLGATHLTIVARPDLPRADGLRTLPGYLLNSHTRLQFNMLGLPLPVDLQLSSDLNQAFELESLQGQVRAAGQRIVLQGFIEGRALYYRLRLAPQSINWNTTAPLALSADIPTSLSASPAAALFTPRDVCGRMPVNGPILMTDVLGPILFKLDKIRPGQQFTTRVAENLFGGAWDTTVRIRVEDRETITLAGAPVTAWRITERMGQHESTVWYDALGTVIRRELPNGFLLERLAGMQAIARDPGFRSSESFPPMDRDYTRTHLTPALTDKPIVELLPGLPQL